MFFEVFPAVYPQDLGNSIGIGLWMVDRMSPDGLVMCALDDLQLRDLSLFIPVKVEVPGCSLKPCWLQGIRVGVDETNSVDSPAKVGIYLSDGRLAATSQVLQMPASLQNHAWFSFPFFGYDKEPKLWLSCVVLRLRVPFTCHCVIALLPRFSSFQFRTLLFKSICSD